MGVRFSFPVQIVREDEHLNNISIYQLALRKDEGLGYGGMVDAIKQ